jgi:hypothetical protein
MSDEVSISQTDYISHTKGTDEMELGRLNGTSQRISPFAGNRYMSAPRTTRGKTPTQTNLPILHPQTQ